MTNRENVKCILDYIKKENKNFNNGYAIDKAAIDRVFALTSGDNPIDILARLSIIDNMYSTQMGRRYYGLEELANALYKLSTNTRFKCQRKKQVRNLFLQLLEQPSLWEKSFIYTNRNVEMNLFSQTYGISKNNEEKGHALSLITKYAYFETNHQFPIYDSIVREIFPILWRYCKFMDGCPEIEKNNIKSFLIAITTLKEELETSYDVLDYLLWCTGKILRGNMNLVLSEEEYRSVINGNFDIRSINSFNIFPTYFQPMMQLAQELLYYKEIEWSNNKCLGTLLEEIASEYALRIIPVQSYEQKDTMNIIAKNYLGKSAPKTDRISNICKTTLQDIQSNFKMKYGLDVTFKRMNGKPIPCPKNTIADIIKYNITNEIVII